VAGTDARRPERADSHALDWAVLLTIEIAAFGLFARRVMEDGGLGSPARNSIFSFLYVHYEGPFLALLAVTALGVGLANAVAVRRPASALARARIEPPSNRAIALVALTVLIVACVTWFLVLHRYLFSMDEYSADFQARIFAHGEASAELKQPWRSLGLALTPTFVYLDFATGRWTSQYLPGYALLKAPFVLLHAGPLLNPLLAAGAVVCIGGVARRLWPGDGLRQWSAIVLLSTSSEFLVTSGTGYSMPAHLCLNLLWLWLYLRGDMRSWTLALGVGLLALELHSPFPHALFVAPFLIRLLRERRWAKVGTAAIVYGAGSVAGLVYLRAIHPAEMANGGFGSLFAWPGLPAVFSHTVNLAALMSWQAPVVGVLALAALLRPRSLEPVLVDLALGLVLTLAFFMTFSQPQGHGWGYRYAYQVIGNLVLIAAAGTGTMLRALGDRRARAVLVGGVAAALVIQIPVRLIEIEQIVRPFAAANAYVQSRPARVVIVHGESVWYGQDLVRNDPYLAPTVPAVLLGRYLAPGAIDAMRRVMPNRVVEVSDKELERVGLLHFGPPRLRR
jgi:hypothetical protein